LNEKGIPKKVLNIKLKGKYRRVNCDQDGNNRSGKMSHRRKKEHEARMRRRNFGMSSNGGVWLLDEPHRSGNFDGER
jgi:hypothetical protein